MTTGRARAAVDPALREAVVVGLRREKEVRGRVAEASVRRASETVGLSRSQLLRAVADPKIGKRRGGRAFVAGEAEIRALAAAGNATNAQELLAEQGISRELRTLQRGYERADRFVIAGARRGYQAALDRGLYLPRDVDRRNQLGCLDHKVVSCLVLPSRKHKKAIFPVVTCHLDWRHRIVKSAFVTFGSPNAETVIAAYAEGVLGWHAADGTFVGGRPEGFLTDNAREMLTEAANERISLTGTVRDYSPSYGSRGNPIVERFHLTMETDWLMTQPGFHQGDKDEVKDSRFGRQHLDQVQTGPEFLVAFREWIRKYNEERPHEALGGLTPLQSWASDETPIERVDEQDLLHCLLNSDRDTHVVGDQGVRHRGQYYVARQIGGRHGDEVRVRYLPNTFHRIWLFETDGRFLCQAESAKTVSPDTRAALQADTARRSLNVLANESAARETRAARTAATAGALVAAATAAAVAAAAGENTFDVVDTATGEAVPDRPAPLSADVAADLAGIPRPPDTRRHGPGKVARSVAERLYANVPPRPADPLEDQ